MKEFSSWTKNTNQTKKITQFCVLSKNGQILKNHVISEKYEKIRAGYDI